MFENTIQHVKNEAAVLGGTITAAGHAFVQDITNDLGKDSKALLEREAGSIAIGLVTGALLSRSQLLRYIAVTIPTAFYAIDVLGATLSVSGRALDADTESKRKALIKEASTKVGREAANTVETLPAMMLGGAAGKAVARVDTFPHLTDSGSIGKALARGIEYLDKDVATKIFYSTECRLRSALPEKFYWTKPFAKQLPMSIKDSEGNIDLMQLTEALEKQHPYTSHAEFARFFRIADGRLSMSTEGVFGKPHPGFQYHPGLITFHTHPMPRTLSIKGPLNLVDSWITPSYGDMMWNDGLNIIKCEKYSLIFQSAETEFHNAAKSHLPFVPKVPCLLIDRENQSIYKFEQLLPGGWARASKCDWKQASEVLKHWDCKPESFDKIKTIAPINEKELLEEHLFGPGSGTLPASLRTSHGNLDLMGLIKECSKNNGWSGVEETRLIRTNDLAVSKKITGHLTTGQLGDLGESNLMSFHTTHPEDFKYSESQNKFWWHWRTLPDMTQLYTEDRFGIMQSGHCSMIYEGVGPAYREANALGKSFEPRIRCILIDPVKKSIFKVDSDLMKIQSDEQGWASTSSKCDWNEASKILSNWDGKSNIFDAIKPIGS